MSIVEDIWEALTAWLPLLSTVFIAVLVLWLADRLVIQKTAPGTGKTLSSQLIMILLTAVVFVALLLTLPVEDTFRSQLLTLIGVVFTGIIALSSTTFISNIMAGLMLRSVKSFSPGDFIRAGELFGRVTERGLFHTEIQSENRDLITLPNLFLAANPVTVVRSSGTVISCDISLGYDVSHYQVEPLLKQAAMDAGLDEPFIQVLNLGDFSITYRAAGFYADVKNLLSTRSAFRKAILDQLHGAAIEIVSPAFMNQRILDGLHPVIPLPSSTLNESEDGNQNKIPETLIFDKAERAEKVAALQLQRQQLSADLKALDAKEDEEGTETKEQIAEKTRQLQQQIKAIDRLLSFASKKDEK